MTRWWTYEHHKRIHPSDEKREFVRCVGARCDKNHERECKLIVISHSIVSCHSVQLTSISFRVQCSETKQGMCSSTVLFQVATLIQREEIGCWFTWGVTTRMWLIFWRRSSSFRLRWSRRSVFSSQRSKKWASQVKFLKQRLRLSHNQMFKWLSKMNL